MPWLFRIMAKIPYGPSKQIFQITSRIRSYSSESIDRYWRQLRAEPDNVKPTLLTKEYALAENGEIKPNQLVRDAVSFIIAGTDSEYFAEFELETCDPY
jgi:hypothetical protein